MFYVYVIQSKRDQSFYIGRTSNLEERIQYHNTPDLNVGNTKSKIPWEYFFVLEVNNSKLGGKIENHIKKMKSKKYIQDLKKYPEIAQKLIKKYS
jgi:putative endonuclease